MDNGVGRLDSIGSLATLATLACAVNSATDLLRDATVCARRAGIVSTSVKGMRYIMDIRSCYACSPRYSYGATRRETQSRCRAREGASGRRMR
ncbi:hypothetical protein BO78DRAFT_352070 [Aspergillus sclerotiicarbonarius CBS 121057]|uniref:Uncharacterized protein n=1 Tax=Aspergillus sclerotiicarbonarius (strain CBS 121057 / IBT 28362) TaxID=1448318 RepID=A0A319DWL1_ASPSB|nr:hypothetical protein BO78DRAFT_352070 [Aspergillus sclerotiicarbonarius CBS 121057]